MKWRLTLCVVLGAAALASAGMQQAATRQVNVVVGVARPMGSPIDELPADAFAVRIDGRPVAVGSVRQIREPLAVVLLADVSGSMGTLRWVGRLQERTFPDDQLRESVSSGLFDALVPGDSARLAAVRTTIWIGPALPRTRDAFEAGIAALLAHRREVTNDVTRSSPIWDAIAAAIDALKPATGRRVVVMVTDGKATANRLSPEAVAVLAVNASVAVSVVDESQAILMRQDEDIRAAIRPDRALRWVAEATGGAYLADTVLRGVPQRADPAGLVRRAIDGHRRAYTITLTVPTVDRPLPLEVSVQGEDVVVRAPAFIPGR